jgi:hypothetical protein
MPFQGKVCINKRRITELAITMSFRMGNGLQDQGNVPGRLHVPIVYEQLPVEPVHWEYRVLTVDSREEDLPDAVQLNELGAQGWLLVGVLDQVAAGRHSSGDQGQMTRDYVSRLLEQERHESSSLVNYYFVRQRSEGDELA